MGFVNPTFYMDERKYRPLLVIKPRREPLALWPESLENNRSQPSAAAAPELARFLHLGARWSGDNVAPPQKPCQFRRCWFSTASRAVGGCYPGSRAGRRYLSESSGYFVLKIGSSRASFIPSP